MGHLCRGNCKRKTGQACQTCRTSGKARVVELDANGKPVKPPGPHAHATPHEKGAAVDLYFDGVSYRRTAENMESVFRAGNRTDEHLPLGQGIDRKRRIRCCAR